MGNFHWYGGNGILSIDISVVDHYGNTRFNQVYYGQTYSDNGSNSVMTLAGVNGGSVVGSFWGVVASIDGCDVAIASEWDDTPVPGFVFDSLGDPVMGVVIGYTDTPGTWSGPFLVPEPTSLALLTVAAGGLLLRRQCP